MCLAVLSPWQLKYNNVLNPEEVYFLVTRVTFVVLNTSKAIYHMLIGPFARHILLELTIHRSDRHWFQETTTNSAKNHENDELKSHDSFLESTSQMGHHAVNCTKDDWYPSIYIFSYKTDNGGVLKNNTKLHYFIPLRIRQRLGILWLVGRQLQWHQMLWRVSRMLLWLCSGRVSTRCIHHRIPCVECLPLRLLYAHTEAQRESWWVLLLNCCLLLENIWAVQHYMITILWNNLVNKGPYYV